MLPIIMKNKVEIPASLAQQLVSPRTQVASLQNKTRKPFTGKPCLYHGPKSIHTDEECHRNSNTAFYSLYSIPALSAASNDRDHCFYIDSGAGRHIDYDNSTISDYKHCPGPRIQLGDSSIIVSSGTGSSMINAGVLINVLLIPKLKKRLFICRSEHGKPYKILVQRKHMQNLC